MKDDEKSLPEVKVHYEYDEKGQVEGTNTVVGDE